MSNELRRTKEKLDILVNTPKIEEIVIDILKEYDWVRNGIDKNPKDIGIYKDIIDIVKKMYMTYIEENASSLPNQLSIPLS